jgi:hypothetical protein
MDNNRINFWVDVATFVVFLVLVFTGFLLHLHPFGGGGSILDISGQDWKGLHMLSAMLFLVLVIVHLVLHRSWGGACGKKYTGIGPWVLGTIVGVLLLAAVFIPFMLVGDRAGAGGGGGYRGGRGEEYGIESNLSGVAPGSGPGRLAGEVEIDIDNPSSKTTGGGGGGNRWGQNR